MANGYVYVAAGDAGLNVLKYTGPPAEPRPNRPPVASLTYSPESLVANEEITFDASSSNDPDGQIVSYEWDFGDGAVGSGQVTKHAYRSAGRYMIFLTVTDNEGKTTEAAYSITVTPSNQPPVDVNLLADAGPNKYVSSGELVSFDGSNSQVPDEKADSYEWDFGDGETATGAVVSHRFKGIVGLKKYTVVLAVKGNAGEVSTDEATVTVVSMDKRVEIVYQTIGEPTTIGAKASYTWIGTDQNGEDIFEVSAINTWNQYFVGGYKVSVENKDSTLWQKRIVATPALGDPYITKTPLVVHASDWIRVKAYGITENEVAGWIVRLLGMMHGGDPAGEAPKLLFVESTADYLAPHYVDASGFPPIQEKEIETPPLTIGFIGSPAELRVYDAQGRVTGLVDGKIKEEVPSSAYFNETFVLLDSDSQYRYEVVGISEGSYNLGVMSTTKDEGVNAFVATDIPTLDNAAHQYTIDWEALAKDEKGVTMQVDTDGDGEAENTIVVDNELTSDEYVTAIGIKGDVNGDGKVRSNDAILTLRIAAGLMTPTPQQENAADMNNDGKVRSNDAILILRKAAGLAAPSKIGKGAP